MGARPPLFDTFALTNLANPTQLAPCFTEYPHAYYPKG